jgi:hypothetical protein
MDFYFHSKKEKSICKFFLQQTPPRHFPNAPSHHPTSQLTPPPGRRGPKPNPSSTPRPLLSPSPLLLAAISPPLSPFSSGSVAAVPPARRLSREPSSRALESQAAMPCPSLWISTSATPLAFRRHPSLLFTAATPCSVGASRGPVGPARRRRRSQTGTA